MKCTMCGEISINTCKFFPGYLWAIFTNDFHKTKTKTRNLKIIGEGFVPVLLPSHMLLLAESLRKVTLGKNSGDIFEQLMCVSLGCHEKNVPSQCIQWQPVCEVATGSIKNTCMRSQVDEKWILFRYMCIIFSHMGII